VYRAISNNTASAVSASRLISEKRGSETQKIYCLMHTVDLAVKHGLGILVRKKKKEVVDVCEELTRVRMKVRELCAHIMDKKVKARFEELKLLSNEIWKCDCIRLELPNATRVAGFYRMLQSLLRNRHLLENAQNSDSQHLSELNDYALTEPEWVGVSQIECILKKMTTLNMDMQSDIPGTSYNLTFFTFNFFGLLTLLLLGRQGLALYEIVFTKASLFSPENEFSVIDITKPWRPDVSYEKLPRKKIKEENFGPIAKTLLKRLKKEFDHYLSVLDEDMKIMTIVHPVAAGLGME
jgi:hypothetical protein